MNNKTIALKSKYDPDRKFDRLYAYISKAITGNFPEERTQEEIERIYKLCKKQRS